METKLIYSKVKILDPQIGLLYKSFPLEQFYNLIPKEKYLLGGKRKPVKDSC